MSPDRPRSGSLILRLFFLAVFLLVLAWLTIPALQILGYQGLALTGTETIQRWSARKLVELGPEGIAGLDIIVLDPRLDARIRAGLIFRLRPLREEARHAIPFLIESLQDPDLRFAAGQILAEIGQPAVPPLIQALKDPRPRAAKGALMGLACVEGSNPGLVPEATLNAMVPRLALLDHSERRAAAHGIGATPRALKTALAGLTADDPRERIGAAMILEALRAQAAPAIPELLRMIEEDLDEVRDQAIRTLGAIGPDAQQALPALLALTRDGDPTSRATALDSLASISPESPAFHEALLQGLEDPSKIVRFSSALTIASRSFRWRRDNGKLFPLLHAPDARLEIAMSGGLRRIVSINLRRALAAAILRASPAR